MIYLDSAATSYLKPKCVSEAVGRAFEIIGNAGRGAHAPTLAASRIIFDTRVRLAKLFGVSEPERVVFTGNVTQSLNTVINGLIRKEDHVITSVAEHNSVLRPLYKTGASLSFLPADEKGVIQISAIENLICPSTKAIIISHASNVTGNVIDLRAVSDIIRDKGILLIVDAAQTAGCISIDVKELGIDILAFTGHKSLLGPQGTGGIVFGDKLFHENCISPFIVGGSGIHSFEKEHPSELPEALEAGTLNGHGIAGLNAALCFLEDTGLEEINKKENALAKLFYEEVSKVPQIVLYGDYSANLRAPIVTFNIGQMDAASVCDILWEDYEIAARAGAHCAPLIHEHFGTVEQGAVRFSFSYFNTMDEVMAAVSAIKEIAEDAN